MITDTSSPPAIIDPYDVTVAELAQSITDRSYISWSQVTSYQLCPMAYAFRYVDRAEPEFTPSSLLFGGAIHAAISLHHEAQIEGADSPTTEQFMTLVRDALEPTAAPIRFNKDESIDSLMELAERMLTAYLQSDHATASGEVLAIEETVTNSLDEDLPDLMGIIDLVTRDEQGHVVITDYKTTRSAWNDQKVEENAGQLRLYGRLADDRFTPPDDETDPESATSHKLQFITITKARSPKVTVHAVEPSDEKLQATIDQAREVWKGVEAGVFPARPGWPCKTCPYQSQCDAAAI
jgi:putative RecB family exonuclease